MRRARAIEVATLRLQRARRMVSGLALAYTAGKHGCEELAAAVLREIGHAEREVMRIGDCRAR